MSSSNKNRPDFSFASRKLETKFGQNFLFDSNITDKIAKSTNLDISSYEVLEIGPGASTLTQSILKLNPKKLTIIEADPKLITLLENYNLKTLC